MEAPSSAHRRGTAGAGHTTTSGGGARRRFDTTPPEFDAGLDRHARPMDGWRVKRDGEVLRPRPMKAAPAPFRQALAPSREADTMAAQRRGGMRPPAAVSPAQRRAPRARRRRRRRRRRPRAERFAPVQQTPRRGHPPARGKPRADQAHRPGGAERVAAPARPERLAVAWGLRPAAAPRRPDLEFSSAESAKPHGAHPFSRRRSTPGVGKI
jgi:hypothetical protein